MDTKKLDEIKADLEAAGFNINEPNQDLKGLGDLVNLFAILAKHSMLGEVKVKEHIEEYHNRISQHEKIIEKIRAEKKDFSFKC